MLEILSSKFGQNLLLGIVVGVLSGSVGLLGWLVGANGKETPLSDVAVEEVEQPLAVDIGGAVRYPGLYYLLPGSRLGDLISAAGGFLMAGADAYMLQKNLNLAETLMDGQKYYISFAGEKDASQVLVTSSNSVGASSADSSLISINQATAQSLMILTGVGEVRAQAIIDNRPYSSLEELVSKKAITQKILDDNLELLTL
jgi:competence protein ComEA